jgi:hypothetical protein
LAPIISEAAGYKIMGILVRDATNPSQPKWLRFDFNSASGKLNTYLGYINASGSLKHIQNVSSLVGTSPATGVLTIRVKYDKDTGIWTVTHFVGTTGSITRTKTFQEGVDIDANFTVTHIGVFVGSTSGDSGGTPPGHTMQLDYFRNVADAGFVDDGIVLTVEKAGLGQGNVNFPITNQNQCNNNTVSITASPSPGSNFGGWTGAVNSSNPTISIEMNASKQVIANFITGAPIEFDYHLFMPIINR